jgi:HPt (histidine-containing phosphotransfer) domain-containing protein
MEQPNLEYINQLARGDESIKNELINVIKTEFPEEKKEYYDSLENKEFRKIEENVHKLKHKISILGLEKSYEIANEFEHNLRELSLEKQQDFENILKAISDYIETI